MARRRQRRSLRELKKEIGIRSQTTVDNIVKGKTRRANGATLRLLREWHLRIVREGAEDDTVGEPTEETKLVAITYLVQDFPTDEQKQIALEFYDELYERYGRTGSVPRWMRRLKQLIDLEWP